MKDAVLFKEHRPPCLSEVKDYFLSRKQNIMEAEHFFLFYEIKRWTSKNGNLLYNWKALAGRWIASSLQ